MHMAAVQGVNNMTLNQQEKMYNAIQANCVIVTTAGFGQSAPNSVIQGKRALAPAPERNTVLIANNSDIRCKRKIQFVPHSGQTIQPASVARRNARERNRVKQVNNGFAALRQHIPSNVLAAFAPPSGNTSTGRGANKKLSKVETLKMAVEYIRSLQQMLEDHEAELSSKSISDNNVSDNRFYTNSPDTISQQFTNYPLILPTPPASESSSSPTPSHTSEGSSTPVFTSAAVYKRYGYDNYDPHSPEDDELLDAIFSWQQNS
ncbi:achaete-scute homolog 1a-like isoform X2 [Photinus pyralis]|nr:achaete-scute homolog 1a-like isoform X1 [Photinus pyralis]XP_031340539.1 achaete-scute homolog 1a-like isoform X2 [Photinus pyralis]XP_031340608.1 achaete-scute homolog 1a-like isoform X1 [Photinus pyralis]XP_031340609.1 achaete-scute homolog 1a-like isoform X2 [Photinus pyralis]